MLIKKICTFDNISGLIDEVKFLIKNVGFSSKIKNQISLQVNRPHDIRKESWHTSIGRIEQQDKTIVETEYKHIHPELRGGHIDRWLYTVSNYGVVRARLMVAPPKSCYSIHSDPTPRVHLPVITNPGCLMCFPEHGVMEHMPADGTTYWVDTTKTHTFINCSERDRIHLIGVVTKLPD